MKRKRGWEGVKKRKDRNEKGRWEKWEKGSDKLLKQRDVERPRAG